MRLDDDLYVLQISDQTFDEGGNPIAPTEEWSEFGKCVIFPNSSAATTRLNDGTEYIYAFEVVAKLKKDLYPLIPKEGSRVRIVKSDGTIDQTLTVKGFVTLKKRYLKIWL